MKTDRHIFFKTWHDNYKTVFAIVFSFQAQIVCTFKNFPIKDRDQVGSGWVGLDKVGLGSVDYKNFLFHKQC